jgi:uroporphyrinogen decarboxylase
MTTTTQLTGRERVNRMFERKEHDRVPRYETFWPETITKWQGQGLDGDRQTVLDLLGSDFQSLCWVWPVPFPGQQVVLEEDETTQLILNPWGQKERIWKGRSGTPEHLGFCCNTADDWFKTIKPRLIEHTPHLDIDQTVSDFARLHPQGRWTYFAGVESFEQTRRLLGDETTLIAMATEPDWIIDVSRSHTDVMLATYQQAIDAGAKPDGLWIYGDMAFNHATMCSPTMYRELIWPDHKRLADFAHDHGMKFIYHTDGDVNGVIDLYLEAGFDCLQPLEAKAHMDVRKLFPAYGDRLAFFGNIDIMVMATNDRDQIEHEVRTKLEAGKTTRGYIYHSDHSVPPSVDWDTYQYIIELVERYGQYD